MATANSAMKVSGLSSSKVHQASVQSEVTDGFRPQPVPFSGANLRETVSMRMYTEEQVAEMLQVSLSQLRKWRMKTNPQKEQGPPFRKIGRLVRYPEEALLEYINGK